MILPSLLLFFLASFGVMAERVEIKAGKTFCFFEDVDQGQSYGVQYQSEEGPFHVFVSNY